MNNIIKIFVTHISRKHFLTFISVVLLLFVFVSVFFRVVNFKTVWVDDILFASNYYEQYNDEGIIKKIFTTSVYLDKIKYLYRPVFILSFYLDSKLSAGKINFKINHITSLLLHLMCIFLFFYFLIKYCCFNLWLSLIASVIFAVNAFSVWSAVWLSGRCDLLLFLFAFSSFIFFIKSNEDKNNLKKQFFLLLHFILFFMALLSKETAVVLPVLCIVYAFTKNYKIKSICLVYIVIYAIYFMMYSNEISIVQRIFAALNRQNIFHIMADYFSSAFLLSNPEIIPTYNKLTIFQGYCIIITLFILILNLKEKKYPLFFLFFSLIFFLPTLLGIRYAFQGNRMYVPMAGLIICCLYIINDFFENNINNIKGKIILSVMSFFMFFNIITVVNMINYAYNDKSFFTEIYKEIKLNPQNKMIILQFVNFTIRQYEAYNYNEETENIKNIFDKDFPGFFDYREDVRKYSKNKIKFKAK